MSKQPKFSLKDIVTGNMTPEAIEPAAALLPEQPAQETEARAPATAEVVHFQPQPDPGAQLKPSKKAAPKTLRERSKQQSLYLEEPVYEQLREMAFHERKAMHALVLEGIDLLFKKRGLKSLIQLAKSATE